MKLHKPWHLALYFMAGFSLGLFWTWAVARASIWFLSGNEVQGYMVLMVPPLPEASWTQLSLN